MLTDGNARTLVCLQSWETRGPPPAAIHWPLRMPVEGGRSLAVCLICLWFSLTLSLFPFFSPETNSFYTFWEPQTVSVRSAFVWR